MSEQRRRHAQRDLAELEEQVAVGEIDEETAARLRRRYEEELANEPAATPERGLPAIPRRALIGTGVALAVFTVVILFAGRSEVPSEQGVASGAAQEAPEPAAPTGDLGPFAEMEAALAAHPDNVELRLGLADAYFQQRDYSPALGHYLTVLEGEPPSEIESIALGRVGWMAFITDQPDSAAQYLELSLEIDPENYEGKLFLGYVRFYGFGDGEGAVPLLEEVLELDDLSPEIRADIEGVLTAARESGAEG